MMTPKDIQTIWDAFGQENGDETTMDFSGFKAALEHVHDQAVEESAQLVRDAASQSAVDERHKEFARLLMLADEIDRLKTGSTAMAETTTELARCAEQLIHNAQPVPHNAGLVYVLVDDLNYLKAAMRQSSLSEETLPSSASGEEWEALRLINNLAMLVRRMCRRLPDGELKDTAIDFLRRNGLQGDPFRQAEKKDG